MEASLGRVILLVDDYDEAYNFYHKNFFCIKMYDQNTSEGQRFLHIRFNESDQAGVWFLKAESSQQRKLVGRQTGGQPTLVLYTADCHRFYQHLQDNGVTIVEPITTALNSTYFHCQDLYGNKIIVVELI